MTTYDLNVSGPSGKAISEPPTPGVDGLPLGPDGDGPDGVAHWYGGCKKPAGRGQPGKGGTGAPGASNGANGMDAFSIVIDCGEFSGPPLTLCNMGGDGAAGGDGGDGGKGGDGGNAGKQPSGCRELINGGVGGNAGPGGNAGKGGDGGHAGNIAVIYGPGFSDTPISAYSRGGGGASAGKYGSPGTPGQGGFASDGETRAPSGGTASFGAQASTGNPGKSGNFEAKQDGTRAPRSLKISVQTNVTV